FGKRGAHGCIVFHGKMWVVGGSNYTGVLNDIWSSPDGIHWNLEAAHAAFSPRWGFSLAVFNDKLWLIGGSAAPFQSNNLLNDVWWTSDGVAWQQSSAAPFSPRAGYAS